VLGEVEEPLESLPYLGGIGDGPGEEEQDVLLADAEVGHRD